ncbi:hypothetical protein [uncultured Roseobacter sp.]|uniref:hypothetical protein n=1 Tax=uncultured Roseobacter sp. TaxID=114847 RepID=UPI00260A4810|nr:hypothetical protein [uncultured Roseobacter sp.]
MILLRLLMVAFGVGVILALASGLAQALPCPHTQPPSGLATDFFNTWSTVIFVACLIYMFIPILSFQIWAVALGPTLAIGFVIAFAQSGEWRFALFLAIQCAITIGLSLTFNAVVTVLAETLKWSPWTFKLLALPAAYLAANGWGYVQAVGFAQSLC